MPALIYDAQPSELTRRCACKNAGHCSFDGECPNDFTQEDFLCDICRSFTRRMQTAWDGKKYVAVGTESATLHMVTWYGTDSDGKPDISKLQMTAHCHKDMARGGDGRSVPAGNFILRQYSKPDYAPFPGNMTPHEIKRLREMWRDTLHREMRSLDSDHGGDF